MKIILAVVALIGGLTGAGMLLQGDTMGLAVVAVAAVLLISLTVPSKK